MLFHIEKKVRVHYSAPVRNCVRRLRVLPHGSQQESWCAYPEPDAAHQFADEFGNRVMELHHEKIKSEFSFELKCVAEKRSSLAVSTTGLPETGLGAFLLPSALCDLSESVRQSAAAFQAEHNELATQICQWTHQVLRYDNAVSGVETTASQSLLRGAGVCQDYAHLMIALCRAKSLPARYVSGYLAGEGRMHAWVEVFIKNQWHGFDPTHNREIRNECLPIAIGRDFRDCNPHQGTFQGRAKAQLESGCRVYQGRGSS